MGETPARISQQSETDSPARRRERNRMLQHYIELISQYQDSRRSQDAREPVPSAHKPPQDSPDMPPPLELIQSIRDAGGDLPACEAVILDNLQEMHRLTGRDVILYAGAFRQGERGPSPDAVINDCDVPVLADIIRRLNEMDAMPDPQPTFHPETHGAHREMSGDEVGYERGRWQRLQAGHERNLDLILQSPGGTLAPTQAIVRALRGRYDHIRVFVAERAMSAATMLACSANQIVMDGFASLSPTNPLVLVPTVGGQMMVPAQAVVDEHHELLYRLRTSPNAEDLMSHMAQPAGLFNEARRVVNESRLALGRWIDLYALNPDSTRRSSGQDIADWISDYYRHLDHTGYLTINDLRGYGLNVDHMDNLPELRDLCMTAFHAAQVAFMLTDTVKIMRCHLDGPEGEDTPNTSTSRSDKPGLD